jgi:hypothetical protein
MEDWFQSQKYSMFMNLEDVRNLGIRHLPIFVLFSDEYRGLDISASQYGLVPISRELFC